jgi:hypothetical protein
MVLHQVQSLLCLTVPITIVVRSMRRALGGKIKYDFVDGSIQVPTDPFDPSIRAWTCCNMFVHSWIMNSMYLWKM